MSPCITCRLHSFFVSLFPADTGATGAIVASNPPTTPVFNSGKVGNPSETLATFGLVNCTTSTFDDGPTPNILVARPFDLKQVANN